MENIDQNIDRPTKNPLQDNLPIANVSRIMKEVLDDKTKISREAKELVQECVGEFIAFITSEASHKCKNENRKTVNGEDILWSLDQAGFGEYKDIQKIYQEKYKLVQEKFGDVNQAQNDDESKLSMISGNSQDFDI